MDILTLIKPFLQYFYNSLSNNPKLYQLEADIENFSFSLNTDFLKLLFEYLDLQYKNSDERKKLYYVQSVRKRTLITSLGLVVFYKTYYKSKSKVNGKYIFYSYIEDTLNLDKWAKLSLRAEVNLINNSLKHGMSDASLNTIPNVTVSRQTISVKIKNISPNYVESIDKSSYTPQILYIEADEVHTSIQNKNADKRKSNKKFVPVTLVHEGHKEDFVKKKQLKNKHYTASSILKTHLLWNETYNYIDKKYKIDDIEYLFVSGDGASWIKGFDESFPDAIYVFDPFHYMKTMNYIFKRNKILINIADSYLRNKDITNFRLLFKVQFDKYPEQRKYLLKAFKLLLNNINGIINQRHPMYKCGCSMEGHISNAYARFLTSRPHAYSTYGLENIVQLITMKNNNIILNEEIYYNFKHKGSTYKKLNLEKFVTHFKLQSKQFINSDLKYLHDSCSIDINSFSGYDRYKLGFFTNLSK